MNQQETDKATEGEKNQSVKVDDLPVDQSEAEEVKGGALGLTKVGPGTLTLAS